LKVISSASPLASCETSVARARSFLANVLTTSVLPIP
jgi:hypothetical protein